MGFSACGSEGQKKVCGGDSGGWLQGSMCAASWAKDLLNCWDVLQVEVKPSLHTLLL